MNLSKNKKYQYLFYSIFSILVIFNGGNSNLLIQLNFILFGLLFLMCLKDKNYNLHFEYFFKKNKKSIILYILFLLFLVLQIIPLPLNLLKIFTVEKFKYINLLNTDITSSSISLSPSESFFQILHYTTLLILLFLLKMIFYSERHKKRFFLFLSFAGFFPLYLQYCFI